ncbi:MAG: hypothetical protein ABGW77_04935 [Campylobacterales bacterium]
MVSAGFAKYLDLKDNRSTIYQRRLLLWRMAESYRLISRDRYNWGEFIRENWKVCRRL